MGERKKLKDIFDIHMLSSMNLLETKWFAQFKINGTVYRKKNMTNCTD